MRVNTFESSFQRTVPHAGASLACVICSVLLTCSLGCSEPDSARARAAPTTAPVTVSVTPVGLSAAQRTVDAVGTLYGDDEVTLSAKVSGRIAAIYHDVGDRVQPAQPLAQIETRDYELAQSQRRLAMRESLAKLGLSAFPEGDFDADAIPTVRKAKLSAENAQGRFNRGKQLFEQQPPRLSEQEFADLQTAWEVAQNEYQVQVLTAQSVLAEARARQAELEMTEQQLADTTVRAPTGPTPPATIPATATTSGSDDSREYAITQRMISVGEFVNSGAPLFRLVDDDPIKLRANIPERFAGEVRVGQTVRARVDAFPDRVFTGTVARVNPQVDIASRSFTVEVLIDNSQSVLKPGGFANVSIETRREEGVIFIPASAVVSFAGVNRVYVNEDGSAGERIVELGARRGEEVEIRSGLKPGEVIVVEGAGKLTPGTPLRVE